MTAARLGWLDGLRGWAALTVVCFHLSPSILGPDLHLAVYRHVDLGKYGVLLFFLVSGYVIPMSLERHGSLRRFWVGRLFRIYPAYLVTIAVVVLLGAWHGGADAVLGHATMLLDPLGLRGAVRAFWTLSYEMIFYLVVAGLFAWRLHRHSAAWAIGLATTALVAGRSLPDGLFASAATGRLVTAAVLLVLVAGSIAAYLAGSRRTAGAIGIGFVLLPALDGHPSAYSTVAGSGQGLLLLAVMFAGTVVYRAQHGALGRRPAALALAVVAGCLVVAQPGHARWAATVAAVAVTFAAAYAWQQRPIPRGLSFLGRVSYSLYLLHVIGLMLLGRLLPGLAGRGVGERLAAGLAFLVVALMAAWVTYRTVEVPGRRIGRQVCHRLATQRGVAGAGRGENVGARV
jgi:peptidoglycan/LPS O-acetylase OafA/YrhL